MPNQLLGRLTELRHGWQADFDTVAAAGTYTCLNYYDLSLAASQPDEDDPLLGCGYNGRDDTEPLEGLITHGGNINVPLEMNTIGIWLRGLLGPAVSSTDNMDGTYTHVFESGAEELPFATLEMEYDADKLAQHIGVMVASMRLNMRREGGGRRVEFGLQGKDENSLVASAAGAVTPSPFERPSQALGFTGQVLLDDVALTVAPSVDLNFSNNLRADESLNNSAAVAGFDLGIAQASGNLTARYVDNTLLDLARAHTYGKLELAFNPHADYSLTLEMPRMRFARTSAPVQGPDGIDINLDYRAAHDLPNTAPMLTATLKNKVADLT